MPGDRQRQREEEIGRGKERDRERWRETESERQRGRQRQRGGSRETETEGDREWQRGRDRDREKERAGKQTGGCRAWREHKYLTLCKGRRGDRGQGCLGRDFGESRGEPVASRGGPVTQGLAGDGSP